MSRIRVMQLLSGIAIGDQSGGAEQIGVHLARLLDRTAFESAIFAMRGYGSAAEKRWLDRLSDEGLQIYGLEPATGSPLHDFRRLLRSLWRAIEEFQPDVITSHSERGDMINALARMFCPSHPRAVRVMHTDQQWQTHPQIGSILFHGFYPLAFSAEIGVSQAVCAAMERRPLARLFHCKPALCYEGIDGSILEQATAGKSRPIPDGLPGQRPLIGIVGRLASQKGHTYLLKALPMIRQTFPVHLAVIGTGPLENELQMEAARLGIEAAVQFMGSRNDVLDILPHLDLLVSASLWEGLAAVILEAMAVGVPVVATDVSGSREVVQTGETGMLVPAGDPVALAQAVTVLLAEPALARQMAEKARRMAARFTVQNAIPCYEETFRRVLKTAAKTAA